MKFIFGNPRKKINHSGKNHSTQTCFEFLILANASKTLFVVMWMDMVKIKCSTNDIVYLYIYKCVRYLLKNEISYYNEV